MNYTIKFNNGKKAEFDTRTDMADFIFDKGYTQKGKALYYEVEDGKLKLVGVIQDD